MRKRNFTSLEVLAEQVRKAELHIFASQGRAEVRKQNFTYLAVKAERKCGSGTSYFWQSVQNEGAEWNFRSLAVKTERKRNFSFGSQGRAEMWKRNIRFLAVSAEQKCGSGTSGFWQSRQSRSVEAEFQICSRQDRAEVQKQHCRFLTVQSSWTCGSRS